MKKDVVINKITIKKLPWLSLLRYGKKSKHIF